MRHLRSIHVLLWVADEVVDVVEALLRVADDLVDVVLPKLRKLDELVDVVLPKLRKLDVVEALLRVADEVETLRSVVDEVESLRSVADELVDGVLPIFAQNAIEDLSQMNKRLNVFLSFLTPCMSELLLRPKTMVVAMAGAIVLQNRQKMQRGMSTN